ncbi:trypsin-like peptidase domain-containing protein [Bowmanella dokdonensis]|uniref:Trypsin-like peptidase domain-containing protein n=1 Tax=Bowmanella dokdonensis TaxID=751969 RepID=A0A939ISK8_9ALTE|nr:trypsin-like peptidase domain-containing protein [Bowmanella dokdonensis]
MQRIIAAGLFILACFCVSAADLEQTIAAVKPSVVGIGVFDPLGAPRHELQGTGFAVGDGSIIATNFHVVERPLDEVSLQKRVVFIGSGAKPEIVEASILATDPEHDLALLKIEGRQVTPLKLSDGAMLPDGREVVFTGFPIGAVLGLYPASHRGMIAATTPVVRASANAQQLSLDVMKRLRQPFMVYQMDATAYPGSSGSPVYDGRTGEVVAVINQVFVKGSKEAALSDPSGITYSIPVKYLRTLLEL